MKNQINELRETLNLEIEKDELNSQEILKISKKLDELIVEYYKISKDVSVSCIN